MELDEKSTPNSDSAGKRSFLKSYWLVIVILLVIITAAVVLLLTTGKKSSENNSQSKNSSQESTGSSKTSKSESSKPISNTWAKSINSSELPLGDGKVSTTPKKGYVDSCTTNFRGGGAQHAGPWINSSKKTWNLKSKIAVQGSVYWPKASYTMSLKNDTRTLTTNDLPEGYPTGTFPIASTDPAFQYDRNPNQIGIQSLTYNLPANPTKAQQPSCTGLGAIGVLSDGVLLFNALDDGGRDAVAHETQDKCNGHPDGQEEYHYHNVPSCIRSKAKGSSTLVGYALDGYGIYVERDSKGNLPTDSDLDACHGRTSTVMWNGKKTKIYHYDATLEYPYTVGCYHGTPISTSHNRRAQSANRTSMAPSRPRPRPLPQDRQLHAL